MPDKSDKKLEVAISADESGNIRMSFSQVVSWISLDPKSAIMIANSMKNKANALLTSQKGNIK